MGFEFKPLIPEGIIPTPGSSFEPSGSLDLQPTLPASTPEPINRVTEPAGIRDAAESSSKLHVHRAPAVEVLKDGERVTHLIVRCGCGETVTIECQY